MLNPNDVLSHISFLLVFLEGLLSFLSPCVLPLLPVYMGYLAGQDQEQPHSQRRIFLLTVSFVIGIFTAIMLMNISVHVLSSFFKEHMVYFVRIGGILIVLLGLHQLGIWKFKSLERTWKLPFQKKGSVNAVIAFLMGFTFSFAWTPCIGPMLSSVLVAAAASSSSTLLIFCYGLGFVVPFLVLGLFTEEALNWLQKKKSWLPKAMKLGGILLIVMGLWMSIPAVASISEQLHRQSGNAAVSTDGPQPTTTPSVDENGREVIPAYDFTLTDQYGNTHTLSDYKGKIVMLQFFATWCTYCKAELPSVQELYEELPDDLVILVVNQPGGRETDKQGVIDFLDKNGYTFPTVFDEDGQVNYNYGITGLPTTYLINTEGNVYGYMPGAMDKQTMLQIIDMARNNEAY